MKCEICGGNFSVVECRECLNKIGECLECHNELFHGITEPPSSNIPACGNLTPMTEEDAQYHPGISDKFTRR